MVEIVIKIPDKIYKFVQNTSFVEDESRMFKQTSNERQKTLFLFDILDAIKNGTPLPEQQPCEDCISRQAVKEMLMEEWVKYMPMELDFNLSFVLEKISELPSVTPTIPDVENDFDIGYNCGYADAMFDIAEGE